MSKKAFMVLLFAPFLLVGCSDDDKEDIRLGLAEAEISHKAGECPKVDGIYKRKEGITHGVLGFTISDNGSRLRLANESTGIDGHTFILDGEKKEEMENGQNLQYVGGCEGGILRLRGSLNNGNEKIDLEISEKDGGTVAVKSGGAEGEYEKVIGE